MMVEWDGTPGYLESTIMADTTATGEQAHEVYMLEANKVYLQLSELNLSSSCAIVGADWLMESTLPPFSPLLVLMELHSLLGGQTQILKLME